MPALSKKQQKFFGIVRAIQKGEQAPTTPETAKAAADMKKSDVKKFASTKHKGLPEKKVTKEGYGNPNVGPALKMARLIDKTKPKPKSKRAKISQYLKRREMEGDKKKYAAVGEEVKISEDKQIKKIVKQLRKSVKSHAKQADTLEKKIEEESNPRIPRKKGQPANSKKHSDLYTDENPKGTIHGLGFKDVATAKASVTKIRGSSRSHAHKIQAAVAMEQRAREMGKTSEAAVYRKFINTMKKKTKSMNEGSLHKWFKGSKSKDGKGGWVNVVTGGTCASDEPGEGTPKCVSSAKRASMSKSERLSAARRKKKADPGQQSKTGAAKPTYVSTDKPKKKMKEEVQITEADKKGKGSGSKDACYHKVKSRYSVWPSAYASGALVKCRKVGAANWGNSSKKEEFEPTGISFQQFQEKCWKGYEKKGMKTMFGKRYPNCVKKEEVEVDEMFGMRSSTAGRADRGDEVGRKERVKQAQAAKAKRAAVKDTPISQYQGSPSYQRMMAKMKKEEVETEGMAYGITRGSGKPSGQMAAFGKKKKENPYSIKNKLKMVIKSVAEKERSKAGVTKEGYKGTMDMSKSHPEAKKKVEDKIEKHFGTKKVPGGKMGVKEEVISERQKDSDNQRLSQERGRSNYGKASVRNVRATGMGGNAADPAERLVAIDARHKAHKEKRGVKTKGMKEELNIVEDDMKGMSVKSGHKRPTKSGAGMTQKGVEAYRRKNPGSKLKTAVTTEPSKLKKGSKAANRRKSYCARSAGQMKKFPKAAKDPDSRLRQARRRWNC